MGQFCTRSVHRLSSNFHCLSAYLMNKSFVARLCMVIMVVCHHEPECHAKKEKCFAVFTVKSAVRSQLDNPDVTVSSVFFKLPICLHPQFGLLVLCYKVAVKSWIAVKVTGMIQNFFETLMVLFCCWYH